MISPRWLEPRARSLKGLKRPPGSRSALQGIYSSPLLLPKLIRKINTG